MFYGHKISVVIPARDEVLSIGKVVSELRSLSSECGEAIIDEVIVCNNGSSDDTAHVASAAGARVVEQTTPGYGRACLTALAAVDRDADIIVFCDGDYAFNARECFFLLKAITQGADLVIGSRTLGSMKPGSLTPPQIFGNWLASQLVYYIWGYKLSDLGPFRAIRKTALEALNMEDQTFGWTIEMQIKAIQHKLYTSEVPVSTRQRLGVSKISGTVRGTIGAGIGILSMIFKLWWREKQSYAKVQPILKR